MSRRFHLLLLLLVFLSTLSLPSIAFAQDGGGHDHGGGEHQPSAATGALAWGLAGFGAVVIGAVSYVLFGGKAPIGKVSAAHFEGLTGLSGYVAKMRLFSRNARLFMIHVVGMDVIYGTWQVMFNLYLLAAGFDVAFIGTRVLLSSAAAGLASIPAGMISDRIERKFSFILGDGVGAAMSLIAISTANPTLLLATAASEGLFFSFRDCSGWRLPRACAALRASGVVGKPRLRQGSEVRLRGLSRRRQASLLLPRFQSQGG